MPANGRRDLIRRLKVKGEVVCRLEGNNKFFECYIDELLLVKYYRITTSISVKLTMADYKSNILNS